MNSGSCGVRYQMSIAHGHRNTFMPHQSLNAVYIFAITRQPTCEGMPKTMEYNSPCSVIRLDTVIEPNRICKSLKCVRKISTSCTALNRWENHIHRWNYLSSIMTFLKIFNAVLFNGTLPPGLRCASSRTVSMAYVKSTSGHSRR